MDSDERDRLISQLAEAAHALTSHLEQTKTPLRVAFPRGYIRPLRRIQARWPYLDTSISRTLACAVQLSDVNRWHLNVWNVGLTAGTVWEWHCALPVIAIIETLLIEYGVEQSWFDRRIRFKKAINVLHSRGVYPQAHQEELHFIRNARNELHLFLKGRVGLHDGSRTIHNRVVLALQITEDALNRHWEQSRRAV